MPKTRSNKKVAGLNIIFLLLSTAISTIGGLVTLPTYLSHIPIEMYGAWLATGNIIAWATVVDPGLSTLTLQMVAQAYGKNDLVDVGETAAVGLVLNTIIATSFAALAAMGV